jgi:predicted metal-dependent phosphoesterase TrpH
VAITDHESITRALEALELAPDCDIDVVPGCEITTVKGHLLALHVRELIPQGKSLLETLARVEDVGGIAIAPHPTARWTHSLSADAIRQALHDPIGARVLIGIETFNGGLIRAGANRVAADLASTLDVARVANSDSHVVWSIGSGCTEFAGRSAQDLRLALESRATTPIRRAPAPPLLCLAGWARQRVRNRLHGLTAALPREIPPLTAPPPAS